MADAPPPTAAPVLVTRVGHASVGHHRFRGYHVGDELVGKETYFSAVSLALGGRRLDADEAAVLDELSAALLGPDPRIWPWKLCRLMSAYGRFTTGLAGPIVALAGGRLGPAALAAAARFLTRLGEDVVWSEGPGALAAAVERALAIDARPPGFGTPFRPEDERLGPIAGIVERHGRAEKPYWKLVHAIAPLIQERTKMPLNAAGAVSAACLDLGFSPTQIDAFGVLLLLTNFVANAYEGAQQSPEVLRSLPAHCIRYVGPPARRSPRASEAAPADDGL
jgi:hypothetical protein